MFFVKVVSLSAACIVGLAMTVAMMVPSGLSCLILVPFMRYVMWKNT